MNYKKKKILLCTLGHKNEIHRQIPLGESQQNVISDQNHGRKLHHSQDIVISFLLPRHSKNP